MSDPAEGAFRRHYGDVYRYVRRRSPSAHDAEELTQAVFADAAAALAAAIAALPETQRRVVVLKLLEGRPFAEIAVRLGTTEEACRMRLSRALATLRDQLEQEGIAP